MGNLQANMAIQNADTGVSSARTIAQIELNGSIISHIDAGNAGADSQPSTQQPLIIPAYTEVVVKLYSDDNQPTRFMTATLTGKIIRGTTD